MLLRDLGDLLHGLHCQAVSGRIARRVDDQRLRTLGDQAFESVHVDLEVFLLIGRKLDRNASGQFHLLRIRCEERCLEDDLVAVIKDGFQHQVHGQTAGSGDEDFFVSDVHAVFFFIEIDDGLPQLRVSAEVGVLRVSCLCVGEGRVDDPEVCGQIRITQGKIDDVVKGLCQDVRLPHGRTLILPVTFRDKFMFHISRISLSIIWFTVIRLTVLRRIPSAPQSALPYNPSKPGSRRYSLPADRSVRILSCHSR